MILRVKFSVVQLLVFCAVVAVCLAYFTMSRNLREAQTELSQMKQKYSEIHVTDPQYVHVIEAPYSAPDTLHWRWEVHLPPSKKWCLNAKIGGSIPQRGIPPNSMDTRGTLTRISGEVASDTAMISVSLAKRPEGGVALTLESHSADNPTRTTMHVTDDVIAEDQMAWLFKHGGITDYLAGEYQTQVHTTDDPLFLLVHRKSTTVGNITQQNPAPTSGIVVWIEEFPPKPVSGN